MKRLRVSLGQKSHDILIRRGLCDTLGEEIRHLYRGEKVFVLTDENVDRLYGQSVESSLARAGYTVGRMALSPGERTKSLESLSRVYDALSDFRLSRGELVLALGGGVIGDLGGFAASTYLRGVPVMQVPTSLLAQVDSSVGGKTGVNLERGKNLVGSFYQPLCVLIDPEFLKSLPDRCFRDGMAEVVKYGCIKDPALFARLERMDGREGFMKEAEDIIEACCRIKTQLVEADERDLGARMLLNFGHTLGHAIETHFGYDVYSHGEAVAAGMHMITLLGEAAGLGEQGSAQRIRALLSRFGLPHTVAPEDPDAFWRAVALDKKHFGRSLHLVLIRRVGEGFLYEATPEFFKGVGL